MKQTAVEKLEISLLGIISFDSEELRVKYKKAINQAKEMEMLQITEAFDDGFQNQCDADLYYNKKFKPDYKNE